ncbi:MAG TPA: Rrf2 family transcriptional regulator [Candidatus Saccharimonadales bacterium]|nr:Rrf2 family transcriptional regulator [Candidatus Saccharimonadales bacterium]
MQLSRSLEQACCVLGIIARHNGNAVTNAELNKRMDVSLSYLSKVTRKLVVAGLICSTQGVNGGYVLAKPMRQITLRMVVEAIEGPKAFFCPSGVIERVFVSQKQAAEKSVSLIAQSFYEAEAVWRSKLEKTTMQQVVNSALSGGKKG